MGKGQIYTFLFSPYYPFFSWLVDTSYFAWLMCELIIWNNADKRALAHWHSTCSACRRSQVQVLAPPEKAWKIPSLKAWRAAANLCRSQSLIGQWSDWIEHSFLCPYWCLIAQPLSSCYISGMINVRYVASCDEDTIMSLLQQPGCTRTIHSPCQSDCVHWVLNPSTCRQF